MGLLNRIGNQISTNVKSNDWRDTVRVVAPTIATALGGPLAGAAVNFLATQFLGKSEASQTEVAQAIQNATPEQIIHLKELDLQFQEKMLQAGIDFEKIAADDRASARAREIAVHDNTPKVLAYLLLALIGFIVGSLIFVHDIQDWAKDVLIAVVNLLAAAVLAVFNYYFGSSADSRSKTTMLGDQLANTTATVATIAKQP